MTATALPGNPCYAASPCWRLALACIMALAVWLGLGWLAQDRPAMAAGTLAASAEQIVKRSCVGVTAVQTRPARSGQAVLCPLPPVETAISVATESEPDAVIGPAKHPRSGARMAGVYVHAHSRPDPRPLRLAHPSQGPPALA